MEFSHLKRKSPDFLRNPEYAKTREGLIDLVCRDCEFWEEDERDYQCGAYKLLKFLLEKDVISVAEIVHAVCE